VSASNFSRLTFGVKKTDKRYVVKCKRGEEMLSKKVKFKKPRKKKYHLPETLNAGDSRDEVEIQEVTFTKELIDPEK
jgi:hypothetical protein